MSKEKDLLDEVEGLTLSMPMTFNSMMKKEYECLQLSRVIIDLNK